MDALDELLAPENDLADERGIGDNQPRQIDLDRERYEAIEKAANEWLNKVKVIEDPDTAAKATDFLDQIDAFVKQADEHRRIEKKPHDDAAAAVQKIWKPLLDAAGLCKGAIWQLSQAWLRREKDRLAVEKAAAAREAQEAEERARKAMERATAPTTDPIGAQRRAEEAAEAAAEAKAKLAKTQDRPQVRGHFGGRARTLRTYRRATVVDYRKALLHFGERDEVRELIDRLANADARGGAESIPGCRIFMSEE